MNLVLLIVQLAVVLITARVLGLTFRWLHQPQVMGEMVAGILLGPSLLGWLARDVFRTLFPADSLGFLSSLSQLGLLLFMFLVGVELDISLLRGKGRTAIAISWSSILIPLILGVLLALFLYPRLSDGPVRIVGFALFMGAAMSVTAFPVLARILSERKLVGTRLGSMAIACASVDDVSAWTMLAIVVVIVRSSASTIPLWLTVGGALAFIAVMLGLMRPLLARLEVAHNRRGILSQDILTIVLLVTLVSAAITEGLGIHALFGAFLAGAILPRGESFVRALTDKLQDVTVVLLLPLYFAFTGLRTSIGLLNGGDLWAYCAFIVVVAIAGKWGGAMLAAHATGLPWREASVIGILMNTRGMVELVLLNVGLDLGVVSPTLFTMMVLMAMSTTLMTTPLLDLVFPWSRQLDWAEQRTERPASAARL